MKFKLQRNKDMRSKILKKKEPQRGEADIKTAFTQIILQFPNYLLDKTPRSQVEEAAKTVKI